jgi:hypothetical protein
VNVYAEKNIAATQEFVRELSYAKDIQDILRIQVEFMRTLSGVYSRILPPEKSARLSSLVRWAPIPFVITAVRESGSALKRLSTYDKGRQGHRAWKMEIKLCSSVFACRLP